MPFFRGARVKVGEGWGIFWSKQPFALFFICPVLESALDRRVANQQTIRLHQTIIWGGKDRVLNRSRTSSPDNESKNGWGGRDLIGWLIHSIHSFILCASRWQFFLTAYGIGSGALTLPNYQTYLYVSSYWRRKPFSWCPYIEDPTKKITTIHVRILTTNLEMKRSLSYINRTDYRIGAALPTFSDG